MPSKHEQILFRAKAEGDAFGVAYGHLDKSEYQISQDVNRAAQEFANKNDYYPLRWLGRATLAAFFAPIALVVLLVTITSIDTADASAVTVFFLCLFALDVFAWAFGMIVLLANHQDSYKARKANQARYFLEFRSGANSAIRKRLSSAKSSARPRKTKSATAKSIGSRTLNVSAKPAAQPFGVSHAGAEALCAEWMKYLGEPSAKVTRVQGDGGIDVESSSFIAQVKNYSGSVGVAAIRELVGAASADGRRPLFFTSGSYTSGAIEFANQCSMPLFKYDAERGSLANENRAAATVLKKGLGSLH
jgi:HJR/Mrr/RecB family endonuclease